MKIIPLLAVSAVALTLAACQHDRARGDYGYRDRTYIEQDRGRWERDRYRDRERYERARHDDGRRDERRGDDRGHDGDRGWDHRRDYGRY